MTFIVATTSLPAVYRPNDDRWNAARSCQYLITGIPPLSGGIISESEKYKWKKNSGKGTIKKHVILLGEVTKRLPDMKKVASIQALLADNFWENCGHFWMKNKCLEVLPINGNKFALFIHN